MSDMKNNNPFRYEGQIQQEACNLPVHPQLHVPIPTTIETKGPKQKIVEEMMKGVDMVNSPSHYKTDSGLEAIDVIEAFGLSDNYYLGNVLKYILRHQNKGGKQDLEKAQWYLNRAIEKYGK